MLMRLFFITFMAASFNVFAQSNSLDVDTGFEFIPSSFNVTTIEAVDWLETSLFSLNKNDFVINSSFRIDEEVPYTDTNKVLIKDLYFLDVGINYTFKKMTFSLTLENLLNLADNSFEIEPEYVDAMETVSVFSHQANTLVAIAILYAF